MEKNSSIFNSKRFPRGFVIAALMIIVIELLVVRFDDYFYFPPYNNLRMKVKNNIALSAEHSFDVVILGDSYNLTGIDPRIVSEQTGLSVFNFSTFAVNSIVSSYVLFRNQVRTSQVKPRVLVLGYLDYIPQMDRETVVKKYAHTFFDFKRGNLDVFTQEFGLGMGIKHLIPSLKHQGYFLLMAKPTPLEQIKAVEQSVYEDLGFYEWHADRNFDGAYGYENDDQTFNVSPFFDKYIRKMLRLAQQENMQVLYVVPSVVPELDQRLNQAGRRQAYLKYISELQREFTNVSVIFPQDLLNTADIYTDQDHLNEQGGQRLSQLVSDWIVQNITDVSQP